MSLTRVRVSAPMLIDDAIEHFGTITALADKLGVLVSTICNWRVRTGALVPELYARRLDDMTGGRLKFEHSAYGLPEPAKRYRRRRASPSHSTVAQQGGENYHA